VKPLEGILFGRYRLVAMLGRGVTGDIWRAYDSATDRVVALTLLPPHLTHDQSFAQQFRRDLQATAELNNPHVVPIHNFGEIEGRLYVDMRLIEGQPLSTALAHGPLPVVRAVKIVTQICTALDAVHRAGLVHGDIKPSNVVIAERDFAYLIDFGIARAVERNATTADLTAAGSPYQDPVKSDAGHTDPRSDMYALTSVLYECLAGRQLDSAYGPEQLRQGLPWGFEAVVANGLGRNPAHRYATALQLAQAVRAASQTAAAMAPPVDIASAPTRLRMPGAVSPPQRDFSVARPWWKGRRAAIAAAAVAAIGVVSVISVAVIRGPDADDSGLTAASQPSLQASVFRRALLTSEAIGGVVGEANLQPAYANRISTAAGWDHLSNVDNWACVGSLYLTESSVYLGAGAGGVDREQFDSAGEKRNHHVEESAALFDSAKGAKRVFDKSVDQWKRCNDAQVTQTDAQIKQTANGASEVTWTIGAVRKVSDTLISQTHVQSADKSGWICQHAMGQVSNMLVEAIACGLGISDQAETIVRQIMQNATS
jgi:serine/threonine protein kinase